MIRSIASIIRTLYLREKKVSKSLREKKRRGNEIIKWQEMIIWLYKMKNEFF